MVVRCSASACPGDDSLLGPPHRSPPKEALAGETLRGPKRSDPRRASRYVERSSSTPRRWRRTPRPKQRPCAGCGRTRGVGLHNLPRASRARPSAATRPTQATASPILTQPRRRGLHNDRVHHHGTFGVPAYHAVPYRHAPSCIRSAAPARPRIFGNSNQRQR